MPSESLETKFLRLVPPPKIPKFPGSPMEWTAAEKRLGILFPAEYKWYVTHYGTGCIDEELQVLNPFTTSEYSRLDFEGDNKAKWLLDIFRQQQSEDPEFFPMPIYPEVGGLIPWASTTTSVVLCWQ